MEELSDRLSELRRRVLEVQVRLDLGEKKEEIGRLDEAAAEPGFWEDVQAAQAMMRRISRLREQVREWQDLATHTQELTDLLALADAEGDEALAEDVDKESLRLVEQVDHLEFQLMFTGKYDDRDAILAVHAGAGGTESQDWAEMLLRMYLRWAEGRRFKANVLDVSPGEEAGIKSATIEINGPYAYGYAKAEAGVHRLVRLSPFDAAHRRHTSFALVEVLPEVETSVEVNIDENDLRVDTYRSTGAGGQHVNKTDSAVRITHLPTGIVAMCQNERSQLQNREVAMKILRARLLELEEEKRQEEQARIKGQHVAAGWGNQIRSYVLHPYNMVKDHRTDYQTSDTTGVLDGDLDQFVEAYLRWRIGSPAEAR
ncbi:MAG: peptide chain release factor 2 [Chloroflexi bacterium]|nr:peptide chain release factor 2 [Chloroflexota bacterium]